MLNLISWRQNVLELEPGLRGLLNFATSQVGWRIQETLLGYVIAQSICTQYSCFENQGRFVTLKKNRAKNRVQKTKVIVIQKEKRQPGLFSF